jgi:hypothetical protein
MRVFHGIVLLLIINVIFASVSCNIDNTINSIEIPFILEKNRIVLEASVNGKTGKFIFDTGSTESYLDVSVKNLWIHWYGKTPYNGKLKNILIYKLNKITFGDSDVNAKSWVINRSDLLSASLKEGYNGIFGNRIFEGYWCELSFSKRKIILHKEKPDYFTKHSSVKIKNKFDADFYIPVSIDKHDYFFNIDTGMSDGIYFPDNTTITSQKEYCHDVLSNDDTGNYHIVKIKTARILDETYKNNYILTNSFFSSRTEPFFKDKGVLGVGFLKYYDFLFDYRELRKGKTTGLYYEPNTPLGERDYGFFSFLKEPPEFGVTGYSRKDNGIVIRSVIKDSIAHTKFGLVPGTIITRINGKPITEFSIDILRDPLFYLSVDNYTILTDGVERTIISPLKYEIPVPD